MARPSRAASTQGLLVLKSAAAALHKNQSSLATETKISRATINKMFQGHRVDVDVFEKVCESLNVTWQSVSGDLADLTEATGWTKFFARHLFIQRWFEDNGQPALVEPFYAAVSNRAELVPLLEAPFSTELLCFSYIGSHKFELEISSVYSSAFAALMDIKRKTLPDELSDCKNISLSRIEHMVMDLAWELFNQPDASISRQAALHLIASKLTGLSNYYQLKEVELQKAAAGFLSLITQHYGLFLLADQQLHCAHPLVETYFVARYLSEFAARTEARDPAAIHKIVAENIAKPKFREALKLTICMVEEADFWMTLLLQLLAQFNHSTLSVMFDWSREKAKEANDPLASRLFYLSLIPHLGIDFSLIQLVRPQWQPSPQELMDAVIFVTISCQAHPLQAYLLPLAKPALPASVSFQFDMAIAHAFGLVSKSQSKNDSPSISLPGDNPDHLSTYVELRRRYNLLNPDELDSALASTWQPFWLVARLILELLREDIYINRALRAEIENALF